MVFFEFEQMTMNSVNTANLEDVEAETVLINGYEIFFVTGRDYTLAYWCNDEYRFTIRGAISREEAEKVIASVGKSNK